MLFAGTLSDAIPGTNHCRGQTQRQLLATTTGESSHGIGGNGLVDRHHQNLIVRKQTHLHSVAETQPVKLRPIDCLIIHGIQFRGVLYGFSLHIVVEKPRGGGHIQPLRTRNIIRIMDAGEDRWLIA